MLSEWLLDDSVSAVPVTNATAAEMILFIVYLSFDDWEDFAVTEKEAKALYRAANVFTVGWLTDNLDAHMLNKVADIDLTEALFIANACNREVICVDSTVAGLPTADRLYLEPPRRTNDR